MEILPLTNDELKVVQTEYNKRYSRFETTSLIAPILGIIALFTPPEVWNFIKYFDKKQGIRKLEDVNDYMFQSPTMIIIVILIVTAVVFLNYYIFVRPLKKDLTEKMKIRGQYRIISVENISKKVSENLDGLDTILHFEKNQTKIKKHLFKKSDNPALTSAKNIVIDQSKNAGVIFSETILQDEGL